MNHLSRRKIAQHLKISINQTTSSANPKYRDWGETEVTKYLNRIMKQIILILIVLFSTNIYAQELKKVEYELNLGTSISIPYQKTIDKTTDFGQRFIIKSSSNIAYFGELLYQYNFTPKIAISSGFNFSQYKWKSNFQSELTERKGTVKESYLNFPFLFQYQPFGNIPVYLSAGPYIGVLLSAKETGSNLSDLPLYDTDGNIVEANSNFEYDVKQAFKSYDFGLSTKIKYKIKINSKIACVFFCRFNYGLMDVRKDEIIEWKNYNLMTGIGLSI